MAYNCIESDWNTVVVSQRGVATGRDQETSTGRARLLNVNAMPSYLSYCLDEDDDCPSDGSWDDCDRVIVPPDKFPAGIGKALSANLANTEATGTSDAPPIFELFARKRGLQTIDEAITMERNPRVFSRGVLPCKVLCGSACCVRCC